MTPCFLKTTSKFHIFPGGVRQGPRATVPYQNRTNVCLRLSFEMEHGWHSRVLMFGTLCKGSDRLKCRKHSHLRKVYVIELFTYFWLGWVFLEAHMLSSWGSRAQLPLRVWDPSSLNRDWTRVPCLGGWILNHCTTREVPSLLFL